MNPLDWVREWKADREADEEQLRAEEEHQDLYGDAEHLWRE